MKLRIKKTADGSDTLFVPNLNEHYHSIHGAMQESLHVFISEGLKQVSKSPIHVFEMGFGTGLNTILTLIEGQKNCIDIIYHSIDLYPLDRKLVDQLNYSKFLEPEFQTLFKTIITCDWDKPVKICQNFILTKVNSSILEYEFRYKYDLIYWDAFGPDKQPELWNAAIFQRIYKSMYPEGLFVTYSAKGSVRRNLEVAGYRVTRIPGPKGKREMIRAYKI